VAPLHFLAEELRARGMRVDMLVGADGIEAVFEPIEGKRLATNIAILTEDGSMGERGRVADLLPEAIERWGTEVVYVAAPDATLRRVAQVCRERRVPAQVAVEGPMACGVGLCFTCVVPVRRRGGTGYDHLRACVEGPVFNAGRISWDLWPRPQAAARGG
jgi:dihydroorotate dehydrogenase electron transfer subunit